MVGLNMLVRVSLWTVFAATWLCSFRTLQAQEPTPNVVMAIAPAENLLADIDYITKLVGQGDAGQMVRGLSGAYLTGIDRKRPAGAYVHLDKDDLTKSRAIAFLPVTSLKTHLGIVATQLGDPEDAGDGISKFTPPGEDALTVYVKENNGWAFYSNDPTHLAKVPADPSLYLGDLPKRYDLAYQFSFENIAPAQRREFIDGMRKQMEDQLAEQLSQGESEKLPPELARSLMDSFATYIDGAKALEVGLSIDAANKNISLAYALDANAGSQLEKAFVASRELTAQQSGVLVRGALYLSQRSAKFSPAEVADWDKWIVRFLDDARKAEPDASSPAAKLDADQRKAIIDWTERLIKATYSDGTTDWGGSTIEVNGKLCSIAAARVAGASKLLAEARTAAEAHRSVYDTEVAIDWDAGTHQGVQIVKLTPKTLKDDFTTSLYGDTLDVYVGVDANTVFYSFGADALNQLQSAIDRSKANGPIKAQPFRSRIDVAAIARFIAARDPDRSASVTDLLAKLAAGTQKYAIQVQLLSPERASATLEGRLSIDDGVLSIAPDLVKVVMEAVQKAQAADGAPAEPF